MRIEEDVSHTNTCCVCMEVFSDIKCSSGHSICTTCTDMYVGTTLLSYGRIVQKDMIKCPVYGCSETMKWSSIQSCLTDNTTSTMNKRKALWGDNDENDTEADIETLKTICNTSKKCTGCKTNIEKNGGCDHIHCICGKDFYYSCMCDFPIHENKCPNGINVLEEFETRVMNIVQRMRGRRIRSRIN